MRKSTLVSISIVVLTLTFFTGFYIFAWTESSQPPTGGNTSAPINVSGIGQAKIGNLGIGMNYIPNAYLGVGGAGSSGDAVAAYANSAVSALYAEQLGSGFSGYFSGRFTVMDGNVGIGTEGPSYNLQVYNDAAFLSDRIKIQDYGGTRPGLFFKTSTGTYSTLPDIYRYQPDNTLLINQQVTGGNIKIQTLNNGFIFLMGGNVGLGMAGTTTPGNDRLDVRGRAYSSGGWQTTDADYAEWFEKEENTLPGDIIGVNKKTGKVRKYVEGDKFIGIHALKPGVIGNRLQETDEEMEVAHTLVSLLGQVEFDQFQVDIRNGEVFTKDGNEIGVLLSTGKVLLGR